MTTLSENAIKIFKDLYSFPTETIEDTFKRVASEFGDPELAYKLQVENIWRPNTPVYMNAGTNKKIFSACYVAGLYDAMNSIYDVANVARKIFQYGAGLGIPIGNLREKEADIYNGKKSTLEDDVIPSGKSSGPITFLRLYDAVADTTKSGGMTRRAALNCSMPVYHPDSIDFIECKQKDKRLSNMNISTIIDDKFIDCFENNVPYQVRSPFLNIQKGEIDPEETWNKIAFSAWKSGDPGIIFIDTVNRFNPLRKEIIIEACNPCGEQYLHPWSCCNLSSINVSQFALEDSFQHTALYETAYQVMGLMDSLIDRMDFPDPRFKDNAVKYRYVGIGIMGLADALFKMNLKYDSVQGRKAAGEIMKTIATACIEMSADLAKEKGTFHDYEKFKDDSEKIVSELIDDEEVIEKVKKHGLSNASRTTIAPTGCLVDGTLVSSEIGTRKIEDYSKVNDIYISPKSKSDIGFSHIKSYFDQGFSNTKKIITSKGYEIEGTLDHKLRVLTDGNGYKWKPLKDIDKGDIVVLKRRFLYEKTQSWLSNSVSELLGFYMADGWWQHNYRLYFECTNETEADYISSLIMESFGKRICIKIYKRYRNKSKSVRLIINSKKLYDWFKKYDCIKDGAKNAFVPDIVMEGSIDNIKHFIKGFHREDDHVRSDCFRVGFTTISKIMAHQLHTLLLGLGFISNLRKDESKYESFINGRKIKQNSFPYRICLSSYDSVKFMYMMDIDYSLLTERNDIRSPALLMPDEIHSPKIHVSNAKNILDSNEEVFYTTLNGYLSLFSGDHNWFVKNDLYFDVVEDIEYFECKHVNDLEVSEKSHTYIANGFVTHNTTALSCDCSYGMEPCFGLTFQKDLIDGSSMIITNPIFHEKFKDEPWYTEEFLQKVLDNGGSLKGIRGIPREIRDIYVTAHDIKPKDRIDMQATLQKHCCSGISSTVNLPQETSPEEIADIYLYAYKNGLKGITVYRDGSKQEQPVLLSSGERKAKFKRPSRISADVFRVKTGSGMLYMTVGVAERKPVEIFLQIGKSGQLLNTLTESLGRALSIAFQHGVPIQNVIKTLSGINSDNPIWSRLDENDKKPVQILSIPDAISQLLDRFYGGTNFKQVRGGDPCPHCGRSLTAIEGCWSCICGYSKCS